MESRALSFFPKGVRVKKMPEKRWKRCRSHLQPPHATLVTSSKHHPLKYAVIGAGFAGLSVAWHLLQRSPKDSCLCVDVYDELGIAGGASGVAGGLLHPYTPKAKLLWRAAECWEESLKLLKIAQTAEDAKALNQAEDFTNSPCGLLVHRRGILRPASDIKNADILKENVQNCLNSCQIEGIRADAAQKLVPHLHMPVDYAVYMPLALNVNPKDYLQALFLACQNVVNNLSASGYDGKEIHLHRRCINSLRELEGEYDAVVICLGARAGMLPELCGKLPLRSCRGVVANLKLPEDREGEYGDNSPSVLSDAWLAVQGPRNLILGSTWQWGSRDYSSSVSTEEASAAFDELTQKASSVYPALSNWTFTEARAGLRAMPPLTPLGSLPLLGCVDDAVGHRNTRCRYWFFGGLGARGLLYHGWLGKLMAQAVLSGDESVLPSELTSWKNKIK